MTFAKAGSLQSALNGKSQITDIGNVTARILDFNNKERLQERQLLIEIAKYPPVSAKQRLL